MDSYRNATDMGLKGASLRELRDEIDAQILETNETLNDLLVDNFLSLGVKYEQATWTIIRKPWVNPSNASSAAPTLPHKRPSTGAMCLITSFTSAAVLTSSLPTHRGKCFKLMKKNFLQHRMQKLRRNLLRIEDWKLQFDSLMLQLDTREAWLEYCSRFPHITKYFKTADEYSHSGSSGKLNLYLLFLERSFHLLRPDGHCGIVIPSGIYTDLAQRAYVTYCLSKPKLKACFALKIARDF
jgi:hypothetical protein